jgi:predicted RNase H-like HicB family nuclease
MSIRELRLQVRVIVDRDGDLFHAYTPDIKGIHASGETHGEALDAIREATSLYFMSLAKHNEPFPIGLVQFDREHDGFLSLVGTLIWEKLSGRNRRAETTEVLVPTNTALAPC